MDIFLKKLFGLGNTSKWLYSNINEYNSCSCKESVRNHSRIKAAL
jgi:DNA-binding MltR family transcriptional regulator